MPRPKKYRPGPKIKDPTTAIALIMDGHWFYWAYDMTRPKHPKVLANMVVSVLANAARRGLLTLAIRNKDTDNGRI